MEVIRAQFLPAVAIFSRHPDCGFLTQSIRLRLYCWSSFRPAGGVATPSFTHLKIQNEAGIVFFGYDAKSCLFIF